MKAPHFSYEEYVKKVIEVKQESGYAIPKDSTLEGNYKMLNKIQEKVDIFDIDAVKQYFTKMKYAKKTIMNYLHIIIHILTWYWNTSYSKTFEKLLEWFTDYLKSVENEQQEMVSNKQASTAQKQKSQDTTKEQVMELIQKLNELGMVKDALILELLLDNPCRMEIGTLKYLKYSNFMRIEKTNEENYLVIKDGKQTNVPSIIISRAKYKTSDKYGRVEFELENEALTAKIINYILLNKIHEGSPVFGYTPPQLAKRLHYLTKKYNNGTTLSTNAICKIHTTHEVKDVSPNIIKDLQEVDKRLEKIGNKRGTSTAVLKKAYLQN